MSQQPESSPITLSVGPAVLPGSAGEVVSAAVPEPATAALAAERGLASNLPIGTIPSPHHDPAPPRIPRWLVRMELLLRVMLRMYIGLAVCYAPWSHTFWDQNPIFLQYSTLSIITANGAVRGIVSGLGLLNLWIAFQDAVRHRDG